MHRDRGSLLDVLESRFSEEHRGLRSSLLYILAVISFFRSSRRLKILLFAERPHCSSAYSKKDYDQIAEQESNNDENLWTRAFRRRELGIKLSTFVVESKQRPDRLVLNRNYLFRIMVNDTHTDR